MAAQNQTWHRLVARFGSTEDRVTTVGLSQREYTDRAALIWLYSAVFWLTVVDLFGMILALQFISPNLFAGIPQLTFSRVRPLHVNGVIFAWLSMMYWGFAFYALPRLAGTKGMWSEKLGVWTAWGWNLFFVLGILTIANGLTQGREYAEFIWPLDVFLVVLWTANVVNVLLTVFNRRVKPLYVVTWWIVASPLWLGITYIIGNVMWNPGAYFGIYGVLAGATGNLASGMADGMVNWWYAHNLFGLWLTPMLLAGLYYLVPRITQTPLYSHTLSLISFWGIAFLYTGVGHHHLLQTPSPGWLKTIAILSSIALLIPVFAFMVNILMTMRGNWDKFFTNIPLRFGLTGFIFYILVNVQGSFQATQAFNQMTHFTNFVVAHAHLALLGAFTFLGMGIIDYIVPQVLKKPLYSRKAEEWQFWLILIGFSGFFWALTIAGIIQGQSWQRGIPEENVLPSLQIWFILRAISGALIVLSGFVQMFNLGMTVFTNTQAERARDTADWAPPANEVTA